MHCACCLQTIDLNQNKVETFNTHRRSAKRRQSYAPFKSQLIIHLLFARKHGKMRCITAFASEFRSQSTANAIHSEWVSDTDTRRISRTRHTSAILRRHSHTAHTAVKCYDALKIIWWRVGIDSVSFRLEMSVSRTNVTQSTFVQLVFVYVHNELPSTNKWNPSCTGTGIHRIDSSNGI